ncbi:S-adenosyl-L-methionine-dependent methyltransferase [Xylogone sp. PMI_703]|nr:S-adenosyl-L-methionine-dependent methyltransferase [Xylogone sp. PMI_703]
MQPPATQLRNGDGGQDRRKRQFQGGRGAKRQRTHKEKPVKEGSNEEVLLADVRDLFAAQKLTDTVASTELEAGSSSKQSPEETVESNGSKNVQLPDPFTEIEVKVTEISSTGDGLAWDPTSEQIYVVPFTAPGDTVRAKVIRHFRNDHYSMADFISVIEPSPLRDDSRINCKYFGKCSGCQFQMLSYDTQLEHKRTIVEKAYKNFSQLPPELVPSIGDTIGSPLQYGYRTKLTPHFDGPPGYRSRSSKKSGQQKSYEETPEIGFMQKGTRKTMDIEDCPIGTDVVRLGMKRERSRVIQELDKYQRGATILLRESTRRVANDSSDSLPETETSADMIKVTMDKYTDFKVCITDNNATTTEYVDDYIFTNPAGSFFQNNNSILPVFTQYIRDHIFPPSGPADSTAPKVKYLIDAYSGSGLFTITLSSLFTSSMGIDIATGSIEFARKNAELNNLPPSQCKFIAADAPELFKSVTYPRDETVVVIDPPRKGCDDSFLSQLLKFAPKRVVYVSCNVHTQARDVGVLVKGKGGARYTIETLRGFDFFPQTGHVEGVAVLNRVEESVPEAPSEVAMEDSS